MDIVAKVKNRGADRGGDGGINRSVRAALTIYDMCKAVDKEMTISDIMLMEKRGEKWGIQEKPTPPFHGKL